MQIMPQLDPYNASCLPLEEIMSKEAHTLLGLEKLASKSCSISKYSQCSAEFCILLQIQVGFKPILEDTGYVCLEMHLIRVGRGSSLHNWDWVAGSALLPTLWHGRLWYIIEHCSTIAVCQDWLGQDCRARCIYISIQCKFQSGTLYAVDQHILTSTLLSCTISGGSLL